MTDDLNLDAKRELRERERLKDRERKERRRLYRRCFWSRPLGHGWDYRRGGYGSWVCVGCGKTKAD